MRNDETFSETLLTIIPDGCHSSKSLVRAQYRHCFQIFACRRVNYERKFSRESRKSSDSHKLNFATMHLTVMVIGRMSDMPGVLVHV